MNKEKTKRGKKIKQTQSKTFLNNLAMVLHKHNEQKALKFIQECNKKINYKKLHFLLEILEKSNLSCF